MKIGRIYPDRIKGLTLIELVVVIAIIGIILVIGASGYGRFAAKNRVRRASNDLLQNMRLARTMAIKENRDYFIIFDYPTGSYRVGFDGSSPADNDLLDPEDGFGTGPVRAIDLQSEYGSNVVLGGVNFAVDPPNGPNGSGISDVNNLNFNPDGSVAASPGPNGSIYIQETVLGYTYCTRLANTAGKINLWLWRGDKDNATETTWWDVRHGKGG